MKQNKNTVIIITTISGVLLAVLAAIIIFFNLPAQRIRRMLKTANKYIAEENYDEAILIMQKMIKIDPKNEDLYLLLADTYEMSGDVGDEKKFLQRAVEALPDSTKLSNALEQVYVAENLSESENDTSDESQESKSEDDGESLDSQEYKAFAGLTPELCQKYKNYVLETSHSNGDLRFKLFYLDDDDIPEMVIDDQGYFIRIISSDGNEVFYIKEEGSDEYLPYGTHARFFECYEHSGRIETTVTGWNGNELEYGMEYLIYDKPTRTFKSTDVAETLTGEYVDICDYTTSDNAVQMCRKLDLIAHGNPPETSNWIGYYEDDFGYGDSSWNQSIYIYYQDENELHMIQRSSSEDGWSVSDNVYYFTDAMNAVMKLDERTNSTLTKLNDTTIMLKTDGGLFMDGAYHKKADI